MTGEDTQPQADDQVKDRTVDPKLLEILVCPMTRTNLTYDKGAQELISRAAGLAYPIRDGIPIMLPEEARELTDEERNRRD
jgi:uncharacterized protein YbaR (Trm112 family)